MSNMWTSLVYFVMFNWAFCISALSENDADYEDDDDDDDDGDDDVRDTDLDDVSVQCVNATFSFCFFLFDETLTTVCVVFPVLFTVFVSILYVMMDCIF